MKLKEAESPEEVEQALEAGDSELEEDIKSKLQDHLNGYILSLSSDEDLYSEEPDRLAEEVLHAGVPDKILSRMKSAYPTLVSDIPEEWLRDNLQYQVDQGAKDFFQGHSWGSRLMAFEQDDNPSSEGIVIRPLKVEISLPIEDTDFELVPARHIEKVLDSLGPSGATWHDGGMGYVYSGNIDHPSDSIVVYPDSSEFYEWLIDQRTNYYSDLVESDPDVAVRAFLKAMANREPDLYKKIRKAKLPEDVLASYAVAFFEDQDEGLQVIREALGMWDYAGSRGETILEVDREKLRDLGITSGRFWDGAPWKLVNLPPQELAYEGTLQRHCVGRYDMGYRDAVEIGDIMIWSLRSQFNKPLLTFEVSKPIWEMARSAEEKASAFEQVKGKLNRLAGETADEAAVVGYIFDALGVDPNRVPDFQPKRAANPGKPRRTFDQPHPGSESRTRRRNAPQRPPSELTRYNDLKRRLMR